MAVENFIEEHPPWQRLLSDISGNGGGGGGSIDVGPMVKTIDVAGKNVGDTVYLDSGYLVNSASYGETLLIQPAQNAYLGAGAIAANLKCGTYVGPHNDDFDHEFKAYDVELTESEGSYTISSMTEIEIESELVVETENGSSNDYIYFVVPVVDETHYLGFSYIFSE